MWMVTGGAGYIGAHVTRALANSGIPAVVLDNLSTGVMERIPEGTPFYLGDCSDVDFVHNVLVKHEVLGVIHLAAFKHARESTLDPVSYWSNNVGSLMGVVEAASDTRVRSFILSSSCSVYGSAGKVFESTAVDPGSPYARSKRATEEILFDFGLAKNVSSMILRFFNVIGNAGFPFAQDTSTETLVPSAYGRVLQGLPAVVFGSDFETKDGSALRDYVDVRDIARGHISAVRRLSSGQDREQLLINLGSGKPRSVYEILESLHSEMGKKLATVDLGRRQGDPDAIWADNQLAKMELNWEPSIGMGESIRSHVDAMRKSIQVETDDRVRFQVFE